MSDIGTRSLGRTARAEELAPAREEQAKDKAKTISLGKRSVSGAEVGQARGAGKSDSVLAPPPPSSQLTAKTAREGHSGDAQARLSSGAEGNQSGGAKISSEYSTLQHVDRSGVDEGYSVLDHKEIGKDVQQSRQGDDLYTNTRTLRPPVSSSDSGHYEVAPGSARHSGVSSSGEKSAPPLPLRSGDFLPGGGIDTLALKSRLMREGAYLLRNAPSTSRTSSSIDMGVRLVDRKAIGGSPRSPRFSAAKKFFSALKNLFSRRASVVPREISNEKSKFSEEVVARGKNQGLGKKDQKQVARLGKEIDSIINKGRRKDGITAQQHAQVFEKNDSINKIFAEDAKRQGIEDDFADPTYTSVEGDYAELRDEG